MTNLPTPPLGTAPASGPPGLRHDVALAPLTTLELGGPARLFLDALTDEALIQAVTWADASGVPLAVIGGGSNVIISDSGFDGLVVRVSNRGVRSVEEPETSVVVEAAAGEPFDELVAWTVSKGLAGLECLSGIPGSVGATPVQNVGAYGQEVADTIRAAHVFERRTGRVVDIPAADCAFAYRDSRFKRSPDAHVVLSVTFALRRRLPPLPDHEQLRRQLEEAGAGGTPDLGAVRAAVLALRRQKSMVIDPADPNRRSVGSFFVNPVVSAAEGRRVAAQAAGIGAIPSADRMPAFPADAGMVKLSAAWLIEHAGIPRGYSSGHVGVSTNHVLALVHHGNGTTAELLALAAHIQERVRQTFGVTLALEAMRLGAGV